MYLVRNIAVLICGLAVGLSTGTASSQDNAAIDAEAVKALVEMSERLQALDDFIVSAEMISEEVLESGERLSSVEQVRADVNRPNNLRLERTSPGRERITYFDGEMITLWGPVTRYYASVAHVGDTRSLVTEVEKKHNIEIPLADLFLWDGNSAQVEVIREANYLGASVIGDRVCNHYAYRQEGVDFQIWIDTAAEGLPCRYMIIDLTDEARPTFQATLEFETEVTLDDHRFTFAPPSDAMRIIFETAGQ